MQFFVLSAYLFKIFFCTEIDFKKIFIFMLIYCLPCSTTQSTLPATHPARGHLPPELLLQPQKSMHISPQHSIPENVTTAAFLQTGALPTQEHDAKTKSFHLKKQNIDALQDQLRKMFSLPNPIPWSNVECVHENGKRYNNALTCITFSNDFIALAHDTKAPHLDLCSTIRCIKEAPSLKKDEHCCVAVVIGESALPSMLPALQKHCDLVLVLDHNPRLLKLVETSITFFKTASTYVGSKKKYLESLIKEETRILKQAPDAPKNIDEEYIQTRMHHFFGLTQSALGKHSPFYSKASFDAVQHAAKTCPVIPVLCNIVKQPSMLKLQSVLQKHNAKITVANVTNALDNRLNDFSQLNNFSFEDGKPAPYKHFKRLPFSPDALCAYAMHNNNVPDKSYTACIDYNHFWHDIDRANFLQLKCISQEQYPNAPPPIQAVQHYKNKDFLSLAWLFIKHEPHKSYPGFSHLACLISIGNIEEITELHAFVQELREKGESIPASKQQPLQTLHAYLQDIARREGEEEGAKGGENKKKTKLTTKTENKKNHL